MVTDETTKSCADHFTVKIMTVDDQGYLDQTLKTVQQSCNTDANNGYAQHSADITSALQGEEGQVVAIVFTTQANGSQATRVFVDDVSIKAR